MVTKALSPTRQEEIERKRQGLQDMLASDLEQYQNLRYAFSGGCRDFYSVNWGPVGREMLVVVDQENPESPTSRKAVDRGNTTDNELNVSTRIHHEGVIVPVRYFRQNEAGKYGLSGTITITTRVPNSMTLEELIETSNNNRKNVQRKDLLYALDQAMQTIRDVNEGIGVNGGIGVFHRDLKPSNILLQYRDGKIIGVKVIDWALARTEGSIDNSEHHTTLGGRETADPAVMGPLTENQVQYGSYSEVYSMAASFVKGALGKPLFLIDPFSGTAKSNITGNSIVGEDGRIDESKYATELKRGLKELSAEYRSFALMLEKALALNPENRHPSMDSFYRDFLKSRDNRKKLKRFGLAATLATVLTGLTGLLVHSQFIENGLRDRVQAGIEKVDYEEKMRLIQLHLQGNVLRHQERYYQHNYNDFMADGELQGWVDMFRHYDYVGGKWYGDEKTAFAAYFNPNTVLEAVLEANPDFTVEDMENMPEALKNGLDVRYETLEPIISQKDTKLYGNMHSVYDGVFQDNIARMIRNENHRSVEKKWKDVMKGYEDRQRLLEQMGSLEEVPNPGAYHSAMIGDIKSKDN